MAKKVGGINYGEFDWMNYRPGQWEDRVVTINGKKGYLFNPEGDFASHQEIEGYRRHVGEKSILTNRETSRKVTQGKPISSRYAKYLPKDLNYGMDPVKGPKEDFNRFRNKNGKLTWARPLEVKGGKKPVYNWERPNFLSQKGNVARTGAKEWWGTKINNSPNGPAEILSVREWQRQIEIATHKVKVQTENFRVVHIQRALKVFRESFKFQRFYSKDSSPWHPLSPFTIKKRQIWGYSGSKPILVASGKLKDSLEVVSERTIETKPISISTLWPIKGGKKQEGKYRDFVYAGLHNEGQGLTGPRHNKPHIQRQFMGHSTYLDPFTDAFMAKMMKLYLFDSVFMFKKR